MRAILGGVLVCALLGAGAGAAETAKPIDMTVGPCRFDVAALKDSGVNSFYYEFPNTAHEWQTWRRSLHEFELLLFSNP